ncbi:MAG: nitroreductase family protein [Chloroflexi bacterium]|nr:MAG: nitroreductase family protein [Chloroflexota bacterium]
MFKDLVLKTRSYRRFYQDVQVDLETLIELVDLARQTASGSNAQPLKYYLSCSPEQNAIIFSCLKWAAYLADWEGPAEGEKPTAYIVILCDKNIRQTAGYDPGIAAQTIMLGASEKGFGGCILASIQRDQLRQYLDIPEHLEFLLVLALGKPKETVVIEPVSPDGKIEYWRDEQGVHHVPKRKLEELIISKS